MTDDNPYFIDPGYEAELLRLIKQGRLLDRYLDLLPREFVPWKNARILDLACGPGGWSLDVVRKFPFAEVVGIDIDPQMVAYASAQAQVMEQEERVTFFVRDMLEPLDFEDEAFDFINARFLQGCLLTEKWQPLLNECLRLTRPGGIIRLTETGMRIMANASAQEEMSRLVYLAFWNAGMSFSREYIAITPMLSILLQEAGYRVLSETPYLVNLSYGTEFYQSWLDSAPATNGLIHPFLLKYIPGITQEKLNALAQACVEELSRTTHREHWYIASIVGQKHA